MVIDNTILVEVHKHSIVKSFHKKIAIVIVHPNGGYDHTKRCLDSLRNITYHFCSNVIIDNGSADGSGERIQEEFPLSTFLRNSHNEGFSEGCNRGIEFAITNGFDHILLLNNDTIVTPNFLEPLLDRIESDPTIASVSGKIYYYPEAVSGKEGIIWYAGSDRQWHMGYNHAHEFEKDTGQCDIPREVAYASGCLMLLKSEAVKKIGGLSEDYFMYWEESDWCMRAKEMGYTSWYEPRSIIYHNVRSSIPGKESPLYAYLLFRNFLIFAKKHYHGFGKIQFLFSFPLHVVKRLTRFIISKNWGAMRAMFKGIRDYLKGYVGKKGLKESGLIS